MFSPCHHEGNYNKEIVMGVIRPDTIIDVKGLQCPRPLLKTKQTLETMKSGQVLEIIATDATTKSTIPSYVNRSGDVFLEVRDDGGVLHHFIRKK